MKTSTWRASSSVWVARKRLLASSGAALIRPEEAASAQRSPDHELHRGADRLLAEHAIARCRSSGSLLARAVAVHGAFEVALRAGLEPVSGSSTRRENRPSVSSLVGRGWGCQSRCLPPHPQESKPRARCAARARPSLDSESVVRSHRMLSRSRIRSRRSSSPMRSSHLSEAGVVDSCGWESSSPS